MQHGPVLRCTDFCRLRCLSRRLLSSHAKDFLYWESQVCGPWYFVIKWALFPGVNCFFLFSIQLDVSFVCLKLDTKETGCWESVRKVFIANTYRKYPTAKQVFWGKKSSLTTQFCPRSSSAAGLFLSSQYLFKTLGKWSSALLINQK